MKNQLFASKYAVLGKREVNSPVKPIKEKSDFNPLIGKLPVMNLHEQKKEDRVEVTVTDGLSFLPAEFADTLAANVDYVPKGENDPSKLSDFLFKETSIYTSLVLIVWRFWVDLVPEVFGLFVEDDNAEKMHHFDHL